MPVVPDPSRIIPACSWCDREPAAVVVETRRGPILPVCLDCLRDGLLAANVVVIRSLLTRRRP
jgi:hypothetical protein